MQAVLIFGAVRGWMRGSVDWEEIGGMLISYFAVNGVDLASLGKAVEGAQH
jgi:hypothetical protein